MRIGFGYDSHRIATGRKLFLGGIEFDSEFGLSGQSDADVLIHAIADAIYGALAEGDIGTHFPPAIAATKDLNSRYILAHAVERMRNRGYEISNLDCTLICESPRLQPKRQAILASLSEIMEVRKDCISVKGKTNEGMGALGRGEGIAATAAILLHPERNP